MNDVSPDAACPCCGERDADNLEWNDDFTFVTCATCDYEYAPNCPDDEPIA